MELPILYPRDSIRGVFECQHRRERRGRCMLKAHRRTRTKTRESRASWGIAYPTATMRVPESMRIVARNSQLQVRYQPSFPKELFGDESLGVHVCRTSTFVV